MARAAIKTLLLLYLLWCGAAQAAQSYSPSDVFAGAEYANQLAGKMLASKGIEVGVAPQSMEHTAKPMHVYELHVSVLAELYQYALKNNRQPPPIAMSTPIKYTPTDVYYLNQLVVSNLEEIYQDTGTAIDISREFHSGKKPGDVLEMALTVRGKLNQLRSKNGLTEIKRPDFSGLSKVRPIDVFLQTQFIIAELNLLKIPMEINSTTNSPKPVAGKTPSDVYQQMKHVDYMLDRVLAVM